MQLIKMVLLEYWKGYCNQSIYLYQEMNNKTLKINNIIFNKNVIYISFQEFQKENILSIIFKISYITYILLCMLSL
jgi:chitinase